MICDVCKNNQDCEWYESYKTIKTEIRFQFGSDDELGTALIDVMDRYDLQECEYFEEQ